jgi:hypothetical protein
MSDYGSTPPPPPPDSGGPGGYGAPPPPMGGMGGAVEHPQGTLILILGIASLVCFQPIGIAAWLMGNRALREIDAEPGRYSNRQLVQIGRILGIIAVVLMIVGIIFLVVLLSLGFFAASTSTSP